MAERNRQQWEGSTYFLPCDREESDRLDMQHQFFIKTLNGSLLLLPEKFLSSLNSRSAKILDVGTGNGAWLAAVQKCLAPKSALRGIDIDHRMFPRTYSGNMEYQVCSVLSLPPFWTNHFDLIHQRMLIAGLKAKEWSLALAENYRVMKHGGYIHLVEVELRDMTKGPHSTKLLEGLKRLLALNDGDVNYLDRLSELVTAAGFIEVEVISREYHMAGPEWELERRNMVRGLRLLKAPMVQSGILTCNEEFDDMMDAVDEEWAAQIGEPMKVWVVTGRKPQGR